MSKPSRALSLTDLVNHDDDLPANGNNQQESVKLENQKAAASKSKVTPDDETDTDDEPGEIVFQNTSFKFDDEEKDAKDDLSPQKSQKTTKQKTEDKTNGQPKPINVHTEKFGKDIGNLNNVSETAVMKKDSGNMDEGSKVVSGNDKAIQKDTKDIFKQKTSNISVKNNIKKDLKILNELASHSLPRKYNTPPVWARKWKPTVKALQSIDSKNFHLEDSILSYIPDDDLTKSVQDWIYATLVSIDPGLRQYVEIEMKYGVIIDPTSSSRVNPPVSSQCVFNDLDSTMKPDIDERVFDELNRYMKNLSELNENMGKFNIIDSHYADISYRVRTHTERPKFLRMSTDVSTGRIAQFIEKRKISHLLIYSPKDTYDTKISISLELPVPENDPPEKYKNQTPIGHRLKKRTSYIHNDSCTRFDITRAESKSTRPSTTKDRPEDQETTFEVELELNTPALLTAFDNIQQNGKDYAAIVRTFLNNGTIVRRKISSLSYEIFEGSKKF